MNLLPAISLRGKSKLIFENLHYDFVGFACIYFFLRTYFYYREKKREKERDELWKKLSELEIERRNALERNTLTATSNNPVPATNTPTTRARP